jgi:hypothetical protein
VVLEDSVITYDSQEEPPLVIDETTQKIKRVPVAYRGHDSNSNNSSTTRNRRQNTAAGTTITILDDFPQRKWLSRIPNEDTVGYTLDSIGGRESYVYMIDTAVDKNHIVSNLRSVGCFFFLTDS